MKIEINEISILDTDNTTLATLKILDDVAVELEVKATVLTYDNLNDFTDKIKEGYLVIFPEHKDKI